MSEILSLLESWSRSGLADGTEEPGAAVSPAPPSPRLSIGRYEVHELLGRGAFGFVVRAFDPMCWGPCALKIPNPNVLTDPRRRQRFLKEPRILARLNHPNVVRVFDADEYSDICYIAMELCQPGSLADWLKKLPSESTVPANRAAELVRQIADGVQHVHEKGIYHRDLKPANILLVPVEGDPSADVEGDGACQDLSHFRPKVGDFGLAKIVDEEPGSLDGARIGTRPYMDPAQIRGDCAAAGPPMDIWALGVILYQLLTRRLPFGSADDPELERKIRTRDPIPLRAFRPDVPKGLQKVCLRCLEKDPRDRYQSARELAYALHRVLDGLPPPEESIGQWISRQIIRPVKRHPVRAALLALATVAGLIAAEYVDHRRKGNIDLLVRQLLLAPVSDLPSFVPRVPSGDRAVASRLMSHFVNAGDDQKLAIALVLSKEDQYPDYREYCFGWLMEARPPELGLITPLLNERMPNLVPRLEQEVDREPPPTEREKERYHRHLANAACALALLGAEARAWSLMKSSPDPQSRTFVIHSLGPAGIEPSRLFERLQDPATDDAQKIGLIQSLAQVSDSAWHSNLRAQVTEWLVDRYRNAPSAGIHGSAKWVLGRWGKHALLEQIDRELAGKSPRDRRFQWRISLEGLTLITIDAPALDRVIEVSDTEITVEMFRRFDQTRPPAQQVVFSRADSPEDSCPLTFVSYFDAAPFCNWLTSREGFSEKQACYQPIGTYEATREADRQVIYEPVAGNRDRAGFRLATAGEFEVYCAAGTKTRRYFGNSNIYLDRYAWILVNSGGATHPVGSLIPNDLGLFDTLGNVTEWCDRPVPRNDRGEVVGDLRGGFAVFSPPEALDKSTSNTFPVPGYYRHPDQGFRVVRTKKLP
jgi:serine/threonine protein kinase